MIDYFNNLNNFDSLDNFKIVNYSDRLLRKAFININSTNYSDKYCTEIKIDIIEIIKIDIYDYLFFLTVAES